MALDFSQYVQNYASPTTLTGGRGVGQQGLVGRGLSRIPNVEDRIQLSKSDTLDEAFTPLSSFANNDPSTWGNERLSPDGTWAGMKDLESVQNAGSAYLTWKESLKPRQLRIAKRKGLLNPMTFKQEYDARLGMYLPGIINQLQSHQEQGKKGNDEMRALMSKYPHLNKFISQNLSEEQKAAYPWLLPKETFMDKWGWDKWSTTGKIALGVGGATAGKTVPWAYKKITGGAAAWTPPGAGGRAPKAVTQAMKELNPAKAKADAAYKRAQAKYGNMDKRTKTAKSYAERIKKFKTTVDKKGIIDPKNAQGYWKKLMTKYPKGKGIYTALAKKVGKKQAMWIAARLGIGSVLGVIPEPITTAAGVAMNAALVYSVAKMLLDD